MPQTRDLKYQSLIRNNLVDRINNAQQHLQILADDKRNATTIGREDPILLQSVHKEERQVLDALESFANDLRILDPTVYRSVFPDPDVPIPRHPLPHSSPLPETRPQHLATSDDPIRTTAQTYKSLKINGPLSVVPVTPEDVKGEILFVDILMGPTGSGKSTFIESLSPEQKLDISGDSLESVTQHVTCYQVVNLGHQLYNTCYILMDTPGFLDPRLPESRIMTMITQKLDDLRHSATMACT
ncbi:hypothetical protein BJ165DRAFT_870354 [Panaeolus papilionaceus]|nr:hypothetical protein BJ165DRAFT_870354 [Panaeolus papilionaceus]